MVEVDHELQHDTSAAIAFLRQWSPEGPWCLTSIIPDGVTDTCTFQLAAIEKMRNWIEARQGKQNLYFTVNPLRRAMYAKPAKTDVEALSWLHVDIDSRAGEDPDAERDRALRLLRTYKHKPTVIVRSGYCGVQGFWKLDVPEPLLGASDEERRAHAAVLEEANKQLERHFGSDNVHNIDRLMRLPGTVNLLTARKRKKKRREWVAELLEFNAGTHVLSSFLPQLRVDSAPVPASRAASTSLPLGNGTPMDVDGLRDWCVANGKTVSEVTLAIIATGEHPVEPGKYGSRSEPLFRVVCELARAQVDPQVIFNVITGPNGIAASVRDKSNFRAYAARQVERAVEAASSSWDRVNKVGRPLSSLQNTVTALRQMDVECRHNVFRGRNIVDMHELQEFFGEFSDQAESILRREVRLRYGFDPGKDHVKDAVLELCALNRFDSLIDHLNALPTWDGTKRLDTWLVDYCGAAPSPYVNEAGATWLLAAVVRAFEPGTKFDHMLVLVGPQGVGKSTALRLIAGAEFFSDANFLGAKDTREVLEATTGAWIVECAELAGMRRKDTETLKSEITKQVDNGRHAYARNPVSVRRRFVLAGTTNSARFLQDDTGNRRFWPVEVKRVDFAALAAARPQLLAEALARYRSGDYRLYLTGDAAGGAEQAQEGRRAVEMGYVEQLEHLPWHQTLKKVPAVPTDAAYSFLGILRERRQGQVATNVCRAMESLGWQKTEHPVRLDNDDKKQRAYVWAGDGLPPGKRGEPAELSGDGDERLPF